MADEIEEHIKNRKEVLAKLKEQEEKMLSWDWAKVDAELLRSNCEQVERLQKMIRELHQEIEELERGISPSHRTPISTS